MTAHSRFQSVKQLLSLGLVAALSLALGGCASFKRIADYPTPATSAQVAVVPKPMSKMSELPVGAYYDEARGIIVSGHQKGLFTGMMFGVVGVIVADQMNKSSAESKYGENSAKSGQDLVTMTRDMVSVASTRGDSPKWTIDAANAGLRLTPYAVFTIEKDGQSRLHAMLRAETLGKDGSPDWSARYFARAPGLHPLEGGDTWMTGTRFSDGMRTALARALQACIDDTHGRLTTKSYQIARGHYPYINFDIDLRAIVVQETPEYIVAKLAVGDALVLAGTHVLDRADYTLKPADFSDPRK